MIGAFDTLVSTKLRPSQVRPKLVARPRLIAKLDREPGRKLTLISAPAGFGKSTLLGEWLKCRGMHADKQLVVTGPRFLDVAMLEYIGRAVVVLNDGFHDCRLLPFSIAFGTPAFTSIFKIPYGALDRL
jgi:hypothetical protein